MSNCAVFFNTMRTEQKTSVKNSIGRLVFVGISVLLQVIWIINLFLWLNRYSAAISLFSTLIAVSVVFAIYGTHGNMAFKVPWMLLIAAFPIFGLCVFLLFGRSNLTRSMKKRYELIDEELFPFLNGDDEVIKELQEKDLSIANQSGYIWKYGHYPVYHNTDVAFYADASQGLEAQLAELKKAEHFIFLEYFIVDQGVMFDRIVEVLEQKSKEGVDVRLIYDDIGCINTLPPKYYKILQAKGIKCAAFNPFRPIMSVIMNNRDHRKIFVVDGKVGFTGGINLADEYINVASRFGYWKDTGIRLEGEAVWSMTVMFLEMWNYINHSSEDYKQFMPQVYQKEPFEGDGFVQPYGDTPLDHETVGENIYLNIINHAERYVYIFTPYLIIDNEMLVSLCNAAKRGVDVRIVTPGIPDKKMIFLLTQSHYEPLLKCGVKIYQYTPGFIHAKSFLCDDKIGTVGSINLDYRSLFLHFECGVFMYKTKALMQLKEDCMDTFAASEEMTLEFCRGQNVFIRIFQGMMRLFAPLL